DVDRFQDPMLVGLHHEDPIPRRHIAQGVQAHDLDAGGQAKVATFTHSSSGRDPPPDRWQHGPEMPAAFVGGRVEQRGPERVV
ncbi:hypothetical protein CN975_25325, partial [Bacillus cereus]